MHADPITDTPMFPVMRLRGVVRAALVLGCLGFGAGPMIGILGQTSQHFILPAQSEHDGQRIFLNH